VIGTVPGDGPDPAGTSYRRAFDGLFERGRAAVLSGFHLRDVPPVEGGRWGLSVVFTPDSRTTVTLERLTRQIMAVAGPAHWPTGSPAAAHVTVRAIEAHRVAVPADDRLVARSTAAPVRHVLASTALRNAPSERQFQ